MPGAGACPTTPARSEGRSVGQQMRFARTITPQGWCAHQVPGCKREIADGTARGRGGRKRHDRIGVQVVDDVPGGVERPGHTNEPVAAVGHRGAKHEFPDTESCAEVGDTRVPGHANVYAGGRMEVDAGGQEVE